MKLSLTVLEILVVSCVFVPFFIFIYKGLNSTSKTKNKAEKITKANGFNYKLKEVWNNKYIGLAEENNMLTYIQFNKEDDKIFNINLSKVKSCELISDYKKGKDKVTRLQYLGLRITFLSMQDEDKVLSFFNNQEAFMENYELQRIKKWHKLINSNINMDLKKAS